MVATHQFYSLRLLLGELQRITKRGRVGFFWLIMESSFYYSDISCVTEYNGLFPDTLDPLGNLSLGRDNCKAVQACGGFICRQGPQKSHFQIHCGRISI